MLLLSCLTCSICSRCHNHNHQQTYFRGFSRTNNRLIKHSKIFRIQDWFHQTRYSRLPNKIWIWDLWWTWNKALPQQVYHLFPSSQINKILRDVFHKISLHLFIIIIMHLTKKSKSNPNLIIISIQFQKIPLEHRFMEAHLKNHQWIFSKRNKKKKSKWFSCHHYHQMNKN